jgi:AraC-like DNA-binding protein
MQHAPTLAEYCRIINIPPPRLAHVDVRRFEDNMPTVNRQQAPFRHELYAVALRHRGTNRQVHGEPLAANVFFNTPYQLVGWDIEPNWQGWYIMFDETFARSLPSGAGFLSEYPFLALDKSTPFDVPAPDAQALDRLFQRLWTELHSDRGDRADFLAAYTHLLLLYVRRHNTDLSARASAWAVSAGRAADLRLVAALQADLERHVGAPRTRGQEVRSVGFYAERLGVSPNHLNAVVKRQTGRTASQLVQDQALATAKALLRLSALSVKEISYQLSFSDPTHFIGFFKKGTGQTPRQYREAAAAKTASFLR